MTYLNKGESIYIPFKSGKSITDSQSKPRMYKSKEAFEKHFRSAENVEIVEYVPKEETHTVWERGDFENEEE